MDLKLVPVAIPEDANVILGQSHFIKTVEDLYEVMVTSVPGAAFGLAFNEASGACLVRAEGNDEGLHSAAVDTALASAWDRPTFVLYLPNAFPVNVLNRVKDCPEVCRIFCATANPLRWSWQSRRRAVASPASSTGRRRRASSRRPTASGAPASSARFGYKTIVSRLFSGGLPPAPTPRPSVLAVAACLSSSSPPWRRSPSAGLPRRCGREVSARA